MTIADFQYDANLAYDSDIAYDAYAPTPTTTPTPVLAHLSAAMTLNPDGSFSFLPQDTVDEIAQSVEVIVGTPTGSRTVVPTFGIPDPTFSQPNKGVITSCIGLWEKRAVVNVSISDTANSGEANVTVFVTPVNQVAGTLL